MFCSKCGKEILENVNFCGNCGQKIYRQINTDDYNLHNTARKTPNQFSIKNKKTKIILAIVICVIGLFIYNAYSNSLEVVATKHLENAIINNYKPILKYCPYDMKKLLGSNYDEWLESHSTPYEEWVKEYGENLECNIKITDVKTLEDEDYEEKADSFLRLANEYEHALRVDENGLSEIVRVEYVFTVEGNKDSFSGEFHEFFYKIDGKWYCMDLFFNTGSYPK